jgi:hypothetical protein
MKNASAKIYKKKENKKMTNYIFTGKDLEIQDLLKILEDDIKSGLYIFKDKNQSIQDYKNCVLQKRAEVTE